MVDDEAEIRSSLEEILREEGYGVASCGQRRLRPSYLVQDAPYDVVLLDIWLPDRDGLDVLADMHALAVGDASRGRHHQRPRHHRNRRQSHQARRIRLS
jgi:DNA-binding response OmpR family regulator